MFEDAMLFLEGIKVLWSALFCDHHSFNIGMIPLLSEIIISKWQVLHPGSEIFWCKAAVAIAAAIKYKACFIIIVFAAEQSHQFQYRYHINPIKQPRNDAFYEKKEEVVIYNLKCNKSATSNIHVPQISNKLYSLRWMVTTFLRL